jgi:hypothetical protein
MKKEGSDVLSTLRNRKETAKVYPVEAIIGFSPFFYSFLWGQFYHP